MTDLAACYTRLIDFAKSYPEALEDHPWGECAIKVRGKMFLVLNLAEGRLAATVKLPRSREFALEYPFASPTGYGLGKSGWVTSRFGPGDDPPLDVLQAWIDESYRAIAPKRLVSVLAAGSNDAI